MTRTAILIVSALCFAVSGSGPAFSSSSLEVAIKSGDSEAVEQALTAGADPNTIFSTFDFSALMLASISGHQAAVEALLAAGATPNWTNNRGYSALSAAVRSCASGTGVVKTLLAAGADIDNRSGAALTPLMVAIQEERPEHFQVLLESGADVNAVNAYGEGALNYAIYYKNPAHIAALMARSADTGPLRLLFSNYEKYYPNFGAARPHAKDCAR